MISARQSPITNLGPRLSSLAVDTLQISSQTFQLAILRPAPIRKRLWQGGVALLCLVATFVIGNQFIEADKSVGSRMLGHDFLAFYSAGTLAREGRYDKLYDLETIRKLEHATAQQAKLEIGSDFGPYWNPPFYAWLLAPFSAMPYRVALAVWTGFNIACLLGAMILIARMLPATRVEAQSTYTPPGRDVAPPRFHREWKSVALVPLLIFVSMPFIQAISHGQNTFCSLLILSTVVVFWRNRMPLAAGIACGLLSYKPQLAAVVAAMLVLTLGLRALIGMGFVVSVLLIMTALSMPDSIGTYLQQLPLNLKFMQVDRAYLWERHVTLGAFWRLLVQGRGPGAPRGVVTSATTISAAIFAIGLLGTYIRTRRSEHDDVWTGETRSVALDRLIGATIVAAPLLMPFYFDYDLLLLAIPATLLASEIVSRDPGTAPNRVDRSLVIAWCALYVWLMFNPPLAKLSGINATVLLLASVAGLSIARAIRGGVRTVLIQQPEVQRVRLRRAA